MLIRYIVKCVDVLVQISSAALWAAFSLSPRLLSAFCCCCCCSIVILIFPTLTSAVTTNAHRNNMCDSVRKRPSSLLSPIGTALQCGRRRRRDGATESHTNNRGGLICIDVEENAVEVGHATSSGGSNMAKMHDERLDTEECEDGRQQAEAVPVNDAEICPPTQAWPPAATAATAAIAASAACAPGTQAHTAATAAATAAIIAAAREQDSLLQPWIQQLQQQRSQPGVRRPRTCASPRGQKVQRRIELQQQQQHWRSSRRHARRTHWRSHGPYNVVRGWSCARRPGSLCCFNSA